MTIPKKVYQVVLGKMDRNRDLTDECYMVVAGTAEDAIVIARDLHKDKKVYIREVELFVNHLDAN